MRWVVILLFVVGCMPCTAQTNDSLAVIPKFAVKWSVFSLAGRFPALQLGFEHRLSSLRSHWSMSHDVGVILSSDNDTEGFSNKKGFKAITELRYYFDQSAKIPFYVSTELYYHQITYDRVETVGYDCETGACSYFEFFSTRRNYTMKRGSLKLGIMMYLGFQDRLFIDLSAGIGYRERRGKEMSGFVLPPNATSFGSETTFLENSFEENINTFGPVGNLRLGYRFR